MTCADCGNDFSFDPAEAASLAKTGRCISCEFVHWLDKRIRRIRVKGEVVECQMNED